MLATLTLPKTASDWAKLPEGYKYQLIAGKIIEWPSMTLYEHDARMEIGPALYEDVKSHKLGEVFFIPLDVHLTNHDIYQPDIIFISNEHLERIEEDGIHGPPDLVIEILSPSTAYYDLHRKKDSYQEFGVQEYWIVDPMERTMDCFTNTATGFQVFFSGSKGSTCSRILPEFCIELNKLFAR
jgi:Uma2 family endonuclease